MNTHSYRIDRTHQVIELHLTADDTDDADGLGAVEQQLAGALRRCRTPAAIIDVHAAGLSPAFLPLLLRLRQLADRQRVFLCITARQPQVAEMLHDAGLDHILRVTRTVAQAQAWSHVCCPSARPSRGGKVRTHVKASLYRFVCQDTNRRPTMTA